MDNKIKVSIIIPVYNVEKYISRCLDSVVNQTLKEIEIILVNDGTKDSSLDICEKYAKKDKRVKIFSKVNEGLGLTRNYGVKRATGEYIAFLDSDDFIELDFYEKLYNESLKEKTDATFACIKTYFNSKENPKIEKIPFRNNVVSSKELMYNLLHVKNTSEYGNEYMSMCVWRAIYKRSIIKENNILFESERKFISEDILFNIDFCMNSKNISFVRDTYYYYCINGNSLTTTYKEDRFEKDIILYKEIIRRLKKYGEYEHVKKGLYSLFLCYVRAVIKQEVFCNFKDKKDVLKKIKKIITDKSVREALKYKENESIQRSLYDFLIRLKCVNLIYFITKLKG